MNTTPAADVPGWRRALTGAGLDRFTGLIAASGSASGHTVVVGMWRDSPLGRFVDVMWVRPDGQRVLLAPSEAIRRYVTDLYTFEESAVVPVRGGWAGGAVEVDAGPVSLRFPAGRRDWRSWLFAARPRFLRRSPTWLRVEDALVAPLGGLLLGGAEGVRLAGRAPGGQREWYSIDDYRPLRGGSLWIEGRDLGPPAALRPGLGVGLSDFPTQPALVNVVTLVEPSRS